MQNIDQKTDSNPFTIKQEDLAFPFWSPDLFDSFKFDALNFQ